MLRKRSADSGPRTSWAFSLGDLANSLSLGDDVPPVKTAESGSQSPRSSQPSTPVENSGSPTAAEAKLALSPSGGRKIAQTDTFSSKYTNEDPTVGVLEAVDSAMEEAATHLMSKALRFMAIESSPPPADTIPSHRAPTKSPSAMRSPNRQLLRFDSSFLDKGIDAINGVGNLFEGFAVTLDNVIGQAFDDWGTNKTPERKPKSRITKPVGTLSNNTPNRSPLSEASSIAAAATPSEKSQGDDGWDDFDLDDQEATFVGPLIKKSATPAGKKTPVSKEREASTPLTAYKTPTSGVVSSACGTTPSPSPLPSVPRTGDAAKEILQWRKRAQILQKELQKLRAQRDEYNRVKEEYEALQRKQNEINTTAAGTAAPAAGNGPASPDPLAGEQVRRQMEALLEEKARLAQENDRLMRENTGLHELLEFTMQQHVTAVGEEELFGEESTTDLYYSGSEGEDSSDCSRQGESQEAKDDAAGSNN